MLNALDYVNKNFKCFSDIIYNINNGNNLKQSSRNSKKDPNCNPFGVTSTQITTRNNSNKENYGGNTNTTNKNASSKSEKKMFIK